MNTLHIPSLFIKKQLPSQWAELTQYQFVEITQIINTPYSERGKNLRILFVLLNLKWYNLGLQLKLRLLQHQMHEFVGQLTSWVFNFNPNTFLITQWQGLQMAGNTLAHFTFEKWSYADTYFIRYYETQQPEQLNKLIGTLFTTNFEQHEAVTKAIEPMPEALKQALYLNFAALRAQFVKQYSAVFSSPEEDKENEAPGVSEVEPQRSQFGWAEIIDSLAGAKFGNYKQTKQSPLHEIFTHLSIQKLKANTAGNE